MTANLVKIFAAWNEGRHYGTYTYGWSNQGTDGVGMATSGYPYALVRGIVVADKYVPNPSLYKVEISNAQLMYWSKSGSAWTSLWNQLPYKGTVDWYMENFVDSVASTLVDGSGVIYAAPSIHYCSEVYSSRQAYTFSNVGGWCVSLTHRLVNASDGSAITGVGPGAQWLIQVGIDFYDGTGGGAAVLSGGQSRIIRVEPRYRKVFYAITDGVSVDLTVNPPITVASAL